MIEPFRALIVEDDTFFRYVVAEALKEIKSNALIDFCSDGEGFADYMKANHTRLHLAMVDMSLPDITGEDVIKQLRAMYPLMPIMVISVSADEERVMRAIENGATGYILKGDSNLSVKKAIEQMLEGIYPLSPALAGYFMKLVKQPASMSSRDIGFKLTKKEMELLQLFAQGMSYQDAAKAMAVGVSTVQTHTRNLYRKMGVHSSLQALSKAKQNGLLK